MQKFFFPKDKTTFSKWLLQLAIENDWITVYEYSEEKFIHLINQYGTRVSIPKSAGHNYEQSCRLIAMTKLIITDSLINILNNCCHALSIYDNDKMIFLIADDFDESCFSCTTEFYSKYYQTLEEKNLINRNYINKDND